MTQRIFDILVLCTGNSARSILGEALFNHLGAGRVRAFSAGSQPTGCVNPVALETLARHGIAVADARSKSWDEFAVSPGLTTRQAQAPASMPGSARQSVNQEPLGSAQSGGEETPAERPERLTFDFIFTVCDNAAGEACPAWPGHPATAHWGIADPAHVEPMAARIEAFETACRQLERRARAFLALPLETMTREAAKAAALEIHEEAGQ